MQLHPDGSSIHVVSAGVQGLQPAARKEAVAGAVKQGAGAERQELAML